MKKKCDFCGRSENEVKLLISGLNSYICESCAQQAYKIVQESGVMKKDNTAVAIMAIRKNTSTCPARLNFVVRGG